MFCSWNIPLMKSQNLLTRFEFWQLTLSPPPPPHKPRLSCLARARRPSLKTRALASLVSFGRARRAPGVISCAYKPSRPFRVVTGSDDKKVNFYSGPPFKFTCLATQHGNFVNAVAYSPNGERFLTASSDCTVELHDGKEGNKLVGEKARYVAQVAFEADGKQYACDPFVFVPHEAL